MDYVFLLPASSCPPIPAAGAPILISTGGASTPITTKAESITTGDTPLAGTGKLNRNFGRIDNLGRYGGGHAGAIWWGLDLLEATGLNITVTAGQAGIDSGAELAANTTLALVDGSVNRVWLSRGGSLNKVTAAAAEPLEPPDDAVPWTFLGAGTMAAGALTQLDRSGVLTVGRGGLLYRRTGDVGAPDDTPPASVRLLTRTVDGLYLWDGVVHWRLSGDRQTIDGFWQDNVGANQTAVELTRTVGAAAFPNKWIALRPGSITGVGVKINAARSAGTLTVAVTKNGASVGLTAVLDASATTVKGTTQARGLDTFVIGDELSLSLTTSSDWAPTSADLRAAFEIEG